MSKNEATKVIRVSTLNYNRFTKLKKSLALKLGKPKVTYDEFFEETLHVAEALVRGQEYYACKNTLYESVSEAWSKAVEISSACNTGVEAPTVLIEIGKDNTFEIPNAIQD